MGQKVLPEIAPILEDPNATGLNLKVPARLFLRGGHTKNDALAFGALFLAKDKKKVASSLASIAKKANLRMRKEQRVRRLCRHGKVNRSRNEGPSHSLRWRGSITRKPN